MSKKTLNEATVRQFMKLVNHAPPTISNFISENYNEEEEKMEETVNEEEEVNEVYNEEEEVNYLNSPKFYVNKNCENLIFSLQNWTGLDGSKGACKDPIDCCRYFFLNDYERINEGNWNTDGGGYYR